MATYPWDTRRDISSRELVDELRLPRAYGDTSGDPAGMVDPLALTALAQGGPYDIQARRALIAKRLLDNELAQRGTAVAALAPTASAASVSDASRGYFPGGDVSQGVGGAQAGDSMGGNASTASTGWGGSAAPGSDFMGGAPPGNSMFGTGDRSSVSDPFGGGAMTTSNAAMVGQPGWDPASESPTFTEPDAAVTPASSFGRTGDDSSQQSQDKQAADKAALADAAIAAMAQSQPGLPSFGRGKGDFGDFGEQDQLAEGATSTVGDRAALGLPSGSPGLPSMVGAGIPSFATPAISGLFDMGKQAMSKGWDLTAPVMTPSDVPVAPSDRAPVATNVPSGRAPLGYATPNEGDTIASPGADPGAAGPGGFSEGAVGGYAGGPGMTTGFGAGYSGSSDFGNTQGAQGFTTGGFSSGATQGFTTGMTDPGSGGFTGGDTSGGGGQGSGGGSSGGGGSSSGGSGDTAGGSPGGVG